MTDSAARTGTVLVMEKAFEPLQPRAALARASALLAAGDTRLSRHLPGSMRCAPCATRWAAMDAELPGAGSTDPARAVEYLARLWTDGHRPSPSCSECEGCWMELDEASRTLVLTYCGAHPYVGWGPAHRAPHPARGSCPACRAWRSAHGRTAHRLKDAGFDPRHWLPPASVASRTRRLPPA